MDKQEILKGKLQAIDDYMASMTVESENLRKHIGVYRDYLEELISLLDQHTLRASNGALLGLMQGLSDWDALCADKKLFSIAHDADVYYSEECVEW